MSIFNHFQNINLTNDQQTALEKIQDFLNSDESIFILKGYAGSGKTTLLKGFVNYLQSIKKEYQVMTPTGRAAKVINQKTGVVATTIHKGIYILDKLKIIENEKDKDDHSFHYFFPIKDDNQSEKVLIVDESSMISSEKSKNELFTFGTDVLLNDLLTYSKVPVSNAKIIFIGDPAQLHPVGDNKSNALIPKYFENLGLTVQTSLLQKVVRQNNNEILRNAFKIRSLIGSKIKNSLELNYDNSYVEIESHKIPQRYVECFPLPEIGNGVIIAFSNEQCLNYNRAVRSKIFPNSPNIQAGDILIINHNNYHTYGVELMNGEMVKVMEVNTEIISRNNIPVYETINGKRIKKRISLSFREIKIHIEKHSKEISCLIIDSLLNSPTRDLNISEMKALYIDFVMRFNEEQKSLNNNQVHFKIGSEEFIEQLKKDKYFNALRVKYGYAITCHKAQGGEWNTTFVDYYGRASLKDDPLRWSYTAITRASNKCYAANTPNLTCFSSFSIGQISRLTNIPNNALALNNVPISPYHNLEHHRAKSLKYWEINKKFEDTIYKIEKIKSLSEYRERYTISVGDEVAEIQADHNKAGIFNNFAPMHPNQYTWLNELVKLVNKPYKINYNIDYNPSTLFLKKLYGIMQIACEDSNVTITNIEERVSTFYVNYFLKTDAKCSIIQFYFNGNKQLTRAIPKSTSINDDKKLFHLLSNIKNYVV